MIWFSADYHLGHANIMKYCQRPFVTVDAMDAMIIDTCNQYVQRDDILYFLGDFARQASRYGHYRQQINCRTIHVVQGNHDENSLRKHVSSMVERIYTKFNGRKFHLDHYPMVSWRARIHGTIHLYGNEHGTMEDQLNEIWPNRQAMDVGIDHACRLFGEYRPFSLEFLLDKFKIECILK